MVLERYGQSAKFLFELSGVSVAEACHSSVVHRDVCLGLSYSGMVHRDASVHVCSCFMAYSLLCSSSTSQALSTSLKTASYVFEKLVAGPCELPGFHYQHGQS